MLHTFVLHLNSQNHSSITIFMICFIDYRRTYLLNSNTIACVKAETLPHVQESTLLLHCEETLNFFIDVTSITTEF